jgi:flagellar motor switch protein FliG
VLAITSPERKTEIVRRIAKLKETSPEIMELAAAALRDKARHFGRSDADAGRKINGQNVLAEILKHSGVSFGGRLLDELEEDDPGLGRALKDRLYTIDDVVNAMDRPIQEKLRAMDDKEIVLLIRGQSEEFTNKILKNVSNARAQRIEEESEIIGPVPRIEVEAAVRDFMAWFRINREEGHIMLITDEDVYI